MQLVDFQIMHKALTTLQRVVEREEQRRDQCNQGICGCIDDLLNDVFHHDPDAPMLWLEDKMKEWPERKGSSEFPVEGSYGRWHANCIEKLIWEGEDGERRKRLLAWLINRCAIGMMNL